LLLCKIIPGKPQDRGSSSGFLTIFKN